MDIVEADVWGTPSILYQPLAGKDVDLRAFLRCSNCGKTPQEDPGMTEKLERLVSSGVETVHIGVCPAKGHPLPDHGTLRGLAGGTRNPRCVEDALKSPAKSNSQCRLALAEPFWAAKLGLPTGSPSFLFTFRRQSRRSRHHFSYTPRRSIRRCPHHGMQRNCAPADSSARQPLPASWSAY